MVVVVMVIVVNVVGVVVMVVAVVVMVMMTGSGQCMYIIYFRGLASDWFETSGMASITLVNGR